MTWNDPEISITAIALSIRNSPIFCGLSDSDIEAVAEISTLRSFRRKTLIYGEGAPVSAFYVLQSGLVKISHSDAEGSEQVLRIAEPEDSFGEESLLSPVGYVTNACAVGACRTVVVPRADFLYLLKHNAALCTALLKSVGDHFDSLVRTFGDRRLQSVVTRVGNWLLEHCAECEGPHRIQLQGSKGLLASELGIASETLSRTLRRFSARQLLEVRGRSLLVKSPSRLRQFLQPQPVAEKALACRE